MTFIPILFLRLTFGPGFRIIDHGPALQHNISQPDFRLHQHHEPEALFITIAISHSNIYIKAVSLEDRLLSSLDRQTLLPEVV